ncbi:helix-turn-helix transcriptional regulator [Leifsonia sp. WHRI 6310E]|uniref:helix-turn-helix domain-containing protein n=1 Tax=Leifsonia sp. WHRI 6310E TaxID=3162562 RepID=UPI0032EAFDF8
MNDADIARIDALAEGLVAEHRKLLKALVDQRKSHQLTQGEIAERMGVSQPTVAAFERYDANPTLSTIRRYALAVGAGVEHKVEDRCCETDTTFNGMVTSGQLTWQTSSAPAPSWGRTRGLGAAIV